ncbi:MAG: hypothetical protein J6U21_05715 [Bacteroidales bacterium]|nr:hypothetical protein [Bacteroidales bacterium]
MELRAEVFQCINPLLDNDSLMRELLDFIKGLVSRENKTKVVDAQHDSDEEIEAGLRQAFKELKDYKDGKITFQSADDFLKEWETE